MPENEFGVIDDGIWVYFEFDKNDTVSQIVITDGV